MTLRCGKAGISVAHTAGVMQWSEPVTIYLAVGASFGVSRYLCAASTKRRRRAALEGVAAALLWPIAAAAILSKRLRHVDEGGAVEDNEATAVQARIEEARRAFVASVNRMLEAVRASGHDGRGATEQTLYALRETVEQYVGLAMIEDEVEVDARPAAFEMELARLSGRRGEDLMVAGRCVHRRNVARIKAHYERERSRLLKKLSELGADEELSLHSNPGDTSRAGRFKMTGARLEIYLRAADLFALLEDRRAARLATQLANAECSALRLIQETEGAKMERPFAHGEERCTEHEPQLIYKDPQRATTFTQG